MFSGGVQNTGSNVNTQQKQVSSLIKHSSYSSASMKNDIMLIKLSFVSKIPFVGIICSFKKPARIWIDSEKQKWAWRFTQSWIWNETGWSANFSYNNYIAAAVLPSSATASKYSICGWGYSSSSGRDTKELTCFEGSNVAVNTCNGR